MISSLLDFEWTFYVGILLAVVFCALSLVKLSDKLPHDQGRAFAVDGHLSKGKVRGTGIIFVVVFAVVSLLFGAFTIEYVFYTLEIVLCMLTGFFDDASEKPWNEYLKGVLDLALAVAVAVTYLSYNPSSFKLFIFSDYTINVPSWLFAILIVALVWCSINVTNCTDGVDGLSATLTVITLGSFYFVMRVTERSNNSWNYYVLVFICVLLVYLWFNSAPSTMLMGDAGSRAMGMIIAITSIVSKMPLLYVLFALVMILDGGLGLIKVALLRFFKIGILKNTRCPLHDQARKVNGWSGTQVCYRFAIIQLIINIVAILIFEADFM